MDSSAFPQQNYTSVAHLVSAEKPHKRSYTPILIGLIVILVLITGLLGGGWYYKNEKKKELTESIRGQVSSLNVLKKNYASIEKNLKKSSQEKSAPSESSKELLKVKDAFKEQEIYVNEDVLGLEDSLAIAQDRENIKLLQQARTTLGKIQRTSTNISTFRTKTLLYALILPDTETLVQNTSTFVSNSENLLKYLEESTQYGIDLTVMGYELGLAINEAVVRNADDASVANYMKKYDTLVKKKEEAIAMDTSKLSKKLQDQHKEALAEFDDGIKIFGEIGDALKAKNGIALQKALQSLVIQGAGAGNVAQVQVVTFWQTDPTIRSVENIEKEWTEFATTNGFEL